MGGWPASSTASGGEAGALSSCVWWQADESEHWEFCCGPAMYATELGAFVRKAQGYHLQRTLSMSVSEQVASSTAGARAAPEVELGELRVWLQLELCGREMTRIPH